MRATFADAVIACKDCMRSARVQLFTYAVIGIACAHAFRQDAAHTTLAEIDGCRGLVCRR